MTSSKSSKAATKRPRRMARESQSQDTSQSGTQQNTSDGAIASSAQASPDKSQTKTAIILGMLFCREDATLEQMVEVTGWLPHTTRAALTGLKKKGYEVTSVKADGVRTYRVLDKHDQNAGGDDAASEPQQ